MLIGASPRSKAGPISTSRGINPQFTRFIMPCEMSFSDIGTYSSPALIFCIGGTSLGLLYLADLSLPYTVRLPTLRDVNEQDFGRLYFDLTIERR